MRGHQRLQQRIALLEKAAAQRPQSMAFTIVFVGAENGTWNGELESFRTTKDGLVPVETPRETIEEYERKYGRKAVILGGTRAKR